MDANKTLESALRYARHVAALFTDRATGAQPLRYALQGRTDAP
jgi:hypothetical protein